MRQNGPDEAARLEAALARIAKAAGAARDHLPSGAALRKASSHPGLQGAMADATSAANPAGQTDLGEVAAALDRLIAELRALLGPQEF